MGKLMSAIPYMGNKYKLLSDILPLFPKEIDTFYDLFGGSGVVSMNVRAKKRIYNEFNTHIVSLIEMIRREDIDELDKMYNGIIERYDLRRKTNNQDAKLNEKGFHKLRDEYNKSIDRDSRILYLLIMYSINYIIRFNTKGEFNGSNGKNAYTSTTKNRMSSMKNAFKDILIWNKNVFDIDYSQITKGDFVYLDPPYLNTEAVYNENRAFGGWNIDCDKRLFNIIEELNDREIKFGLSNVFTCRGKENTHLIEWCDKNCFNVFHFNRNYHPFSRGLSNNDEVYITNCNVKQSKQLTLF